MTNKFAVKAAVAAVALALSASASAFNMIQIDYTGTGSVGGSKIADKLDNDPGNILLQGIEPGALFPTGTVPVNVLGMGTAAFKSGSTSLNPAGIELTYVFGVAADAAYTLGFGGENGFHIETAGGGYFQVYIQASGIANALAGTGFNTGTLLMSGTFIPQSFPVDVNTYTIPTTCPGSCDGLPLLDQFAGDSYSGLRTQPVQGSANYFIDLTYQNPLYILNNISTFDPFSRDMNFNTSTLTPFNSTDPAAQFRNVGDTGFTPVNYGNDTTPGGFLKNDTLCGTATPCDLHLQGDANSTFNTGPTIPEPASMALLGLGLGAIGFVGRRRKSGKVA